VSALDELREHFREAAARELAGKRVRRRRQRRVTGVLIALLVGSAAVAGAADLIAVGEPAPDLRIQGDAYKPPANALRPTVLVKAEVAGMRLPYGVGAYTANNGQRCLVVGSLLGYTLGLTDRDEFKPYDRGKVGSCAPPGRLNQDRWTDHGHTLLFGVGTKATPQAVVTVEGKVYRPPPGRERAFLVVFDGTLELEDFAVHFVR
jgi:hypothetical protein